MLYTCNHMHIHPTMMFVWMAILVWVICSIYLQNFRVTAILEMRCFEECVLDMRCFEVTAHTVLLDINYHLWQQFYTSKGILLSMARYKI